MTTMHGERQRESAAHNEGFLDSQFVRQQLDDDLLRKKLRKDLDETGYRKFTSAAGLPRKEGAEVNPQENDNRLVAWIVTNRAVIGSLLNEDCEYSKYVSNSPYSELGGGEFALSMDVYENSRGHTEQKDLMLNLLRKQGQCANAYERLAAEAVRQAKEYTLTTDHFDLVEFSRQAALRFCWLLWGYAAKDFVLLEATAARSYSALAHVVLGRHLNGQSTVIPLAQQAMARLAERTVQLIEEYVDVESDKRDDETRPTYQTNRKIMPVGVDPRSEWGLSCTGDPLLHEMAKLDGDLTIQERAMIAVGMIAGTVGNITASVCIAIKHWFDLKQKEPMSCKLIARALIENPPVPFLPRRVNTRKQIPGLDCKVGDELLLWICQPDNNAAQDTQLIYGGEHSAHQCPGKTPADVLIRTITMAVAELPSLAQTMDATTGEPIGLKRRLGFECLSYPLRYRRSIRLVQQPLNIVMTVKPPVKDNANALRQLIRLGSPRIADALKKSGVVHFAWFEFINQDRELALHTVYDGDFNAYVRHFALDVGDLFDQLFEYIETRPPRPVAKNPDAFVNLMRAHNRPAVEHYFFSAYPDQNVTRIRRHAGKPT